MGKRGLSPFVRSTRRAVPANGDCPLFHRFGRGAGGEGRPAVRSPASISHLSSRRKMPCAFMFVTEAELLASASSAAA